MKRAKARVIIAVGLVSFAFCAYSLAQVQSETNTNSNMSANLQERKLQLEIEDLERKDKFSALRNKPTLSNLVNLLKIQCRSPQFVQQT